MSDGDLREGETIAHYRVGRRLGGGGMGVVHEALDESLGRKVALKVIAPSLAQDPDFRARFTREAQAQASLDSPHVVHVYGHGEDGGRLWLASQLVPDGDLRTMLDEYGAPPLPIALEVMQQVAAGLATAHLAGLVHRDIKPANVLLRRRDGGGFQAYLADFGIARRVDGELTRTGAGATVGTPSYMAPELHTGGAPGVPSDLYSLGCLLWATLSGRAPYAGTSDFEIVTAHREQPVPQLEQDGPVSAGLNALLARLLAKDPADRPRSAAEVRDQLARLASPEPLAPVPMTPTRRWKPVAFAAAGLVAAGVVLAIALTLTGAGDGPQARDAEVTPTSATPTPSDTPTPSETPTPTPTPTPTAVPTTGQEPAAIAAIGAAFATTGGLGEKLGTCVATQLVGLVGVPRLIEMGMLTPELTYVNVDLADSPDIKTALSAATTTCLAG